MDFIAAHWLDITTTALGLAYILLEYKASVWMWDVGFFMQMRDLTPTLLLSLLTGALIYAFTRLVHLPEAALLTIGILAAAAIYLTVARLTRMPELREALDIIHRR